MRALLLLPLLFLMACTQLQAGDAGLSKVIEGAQQINDRRAEVYAMVPCAMPAGGFESLEDFNIQMAVGNLCFPKFLSAYRAHFLSTAR